MYDSAHLVVAGERGRREQRLKVVLTGKPSASQLFPLESSENSSQNADVGQEKSASPSMF